VGLPQQMRGACEPRGTEPAWEERDVSVRGRSGIGPSWGSAAGTSLKLQGWARRSPRRQGQNCLPLKFCETCAEDPCGEGGNLTIRLRQSKSVEELRHRKRCDALSEVRIEPFGSQALPDPKLAWRQECRERGQFARASGPWDQHCVDQLGGRSHRSKSDNREFSLTARRSEACRI
jgi:hypothetical protein